MHRHLSAYSYTTEIFAAPDFSLLATLMYTCSDDVWSVVRGLWSVDCGLWSVVCGLWSVVLYLADRGEFETSTFPYLLPSRSPSSTRRVLP